MDKDTRIANLESENTALRADVAALTAKVSLLLESLSKASIKKDSHNSHNPPSQDKSVPKRRKSLRKKSNRRSGGQPGHKGHSLKLSAHPDEEEALKSTYCEQCGSVLAADAYVLVSKRQVVDLPVIRPHYKEYVQYGCSCDCGHFQKAAYPHGVNAPIQYGSNVQAYTAYFNVFQYIPYRRLSLLFKDIFNLSLSEGSVRNLLGRVADQSTPVYDAIHEQIKMASFVGSDETGAKVNGQKWWIWVWQNMHNTWLKASNNRGFATVEAAFPQGLPNTTVGSDRLAAQLKIKSKNKQLCLPHLLRDLIFLEETEKNEWATKFKQLLKEALQLRKNIPQNGIAFQKEQPDAQRIEQRLNELLAQIISKEQHPQTLTFQRSMIKNRNYIFSFLYNLDVPPDNNASERAIRNVKVKQKISGQFKTGQHDFCVIRSVIDTLRKRELHVLDYLQKIVCTPVPE